MSTFQVVAIVGALALAGCGKRKGQPQSAMSGMRGMPGMAMRSDSLMPMMRADLDSLARMPAQFAAGMLQAHEAMASQILDAMGSDMTAMGMRSDPAWTCSKALVKRIYGHLGTVRHRAKVVEYRVAQHRKVLKEKLAALRGGAGEH